MRHATWATHADADPSATIRPEPEVVTEESPFSRAPLDLEFSETLGEGAMGLVRLATQPKLERDVAVKSLRNPTPQSVGKLLREARVTGALQHPNIVPVYDILVDRAHQPHILMKRITGVEWESVIDDAAAVQERFGTHDLLGWNLAILNTLCNALHCAHAEGVIHRDLKPSNVMIGAFGEVYLVDWGIACAIEEPDPGIAGTPRYMAPEMAEGLHAGVASDVYLLGGLLHRVLCGRAPHRGFSIEEILENIPRFAPDFPPDTPQALRQLVLDAMATDPSLRPESAEAFRVRIATFVERRGAVAMCDRALERVPMLLQALETAESKLVYQELAACQFGFRSSLEAWPDNPRAQQGLDEAISAVVAFEIRRGDASAARALLITLNDVDPELLAQLEALEVERAAEEQERLRLLRESDQNVGVRTRLALVLVFGVIWVLITIWGHFWIGVPGHRAQAGIAVATAAATLAFCIWARDSLTATRMNRMTAGLMLASPLAQLALVGVLSARDVDPTLNVALDNLLYAALLLAAALAMDLRVFVSSLGFGLAAMVGALFPDLVLLASAGGLLIFLANLVWIWGPSVQAEPGESVP